MVNNLFTVGVTGMLAATMAGCFLADHDDSADHASPPLPVLGERGGRGR
jgi:hypothetical protein